MNNKPCYLETMQEMNKRYSLIGDVLEFGTCTCQSAIELATRFPDKTIFTIDHFKGLEKTNKPLPRTSDWREGAFALGRPEFHNLSEFPKTIEEALQKLSVKKNIKPIVEDIHSLKDPSEYGITDIALVNIDVDIYEPTVSSLNFLSKCIWNQVFIRFDDWHGGVSEYDPHERAAFLEWVSKNNYKYDLTHNGMYGGVFVKR